MEEEKTALGRWLMEATRAIRFAPDRRAVEAELRAHIEDKTADLMRIFPSLPQEEARDMALAQMGDAAEIGQALAKIHKPWLGYLWKLSRWASRITVAFMLLGTLGRIIDGGLGGWYEARDSLTNHRLEQIPLVTPTDTARVDGATVSLVKAVRIEDGADQRLGVRLRVTSPEFWVERGAAVRHYTGAVDDRGNRYPAFQSEYKALLSTGNYAYTDAAWGTRTPFYQDYDLWVMGLDPEAQWVRLEYNRMDRSFELTIELKEAEA